MDNKFDSPFEAKYHILNTLIKELDQELEEDFADDPNSKPDIEVVINNDLTMAQANLISPFVNDDGDIDYTTMTKSLGKNLDETLLKLFNIRLDISYMIANQKDFLPDANAIIIGVTGLANFDLIFNYKATKLKFLK